MSFFYWPIKARRKVVTTSANDDASTLEFNATRLRNVCALVGIACEVPKDDATLDGARGAVLGQVAYRLRALARERMDERLSTSMLARDAALEEAAKVCDEQQKEGECPERASYCADAIRAMKSFPG